MHILGEYFLHVIHFKGISAWDHPFDDHFLLLSVSKNMFIEFFLKCLLYKMDIYIYNPRDNKN